MADPTIAPDPLPGPSAGSGGPTTVRRTLAYGRLDDELILLPPLTLGCAGGLLRDPLDGRVVR